MSKPLPTSFLFHDTAETVEPQEMRVERQRKQVAFLEAVGDYGWRTACRIAGCTEQDVHRWCRIYPEFAAAHRATAEATADRLERIVDEIATGERESTPQQMQALQFRLKGLRPDVYRERSQVQVEAVHRAEADGDAGRARALLADWSTPPTRATPDAPSPAPHDA